MEEEWKDIEGYNGLYQISNFGRVKSFYHKKTKILLLHYNTGGYFYVNLYFNKKHKAEMVHRLVAKAFVPNPNNYNIVMHLDDNKTNNYYLNLKWGTQKENLSAAHFKEEQSKLASKRIGEKNPFYGKTHTEETKKKLSIHASKRTGKLSPSSKKIICENRIFYSIKECSSYYNIKYSTMVSWLNGSNPLPKFWEEKGLSYYE